MTEDKEEPERHPRKQRVISRTQAKRVENMMHAYVNQQTGRFERLQSSLEEALHGAHMELDQHRRAIAKYKAILEAVCRRHGTQIFDVAELQQRCARGHIEMVVDQQRVTLKLLPELDVIENATSVVDGGDSA